MRISADSYLSQVNNTNSVRSNFRKTQQLLSLLVILSVFWGLKLTGITMAGEAFCGIEEHVHSEACQGPELICGQPEVPAHIHTEQCLSRGLQCGLPEQEGHTHTESCLNITLTCPLEEAEGHSHDDTCYGTILTCDLPEDESHTHDDSCYTFGCLCGLEESQGHIHTEDCYTISLDYLCGKEELPEHFHTDACYYIEEGIYICGLEETEGHAHSEACYRTEGACLLPEHVHTPNCYSDTSADLETSDNWEDSFIGMTRSPFTDENIIMVARSQLGIAESTRNFQVDELGVRRGITRYGQWYGNPYADWSAMFVSFCLDYAGVFDAPLNAGTEAMRLEWMDAGLYSDPAEHTPEPGQLLFLDKDENGTADAVAIVTDLQDSVIFAIEGDLAEPVTRIGSVTLGSEDNEEAEILPESAGDEASPESPTEEIPAQTEGEYILADLSVTTEETEETAEGNSVDMVAETLYSLEDPAILGYGLVPVAPLRVMLPSTTAAGDVIASTITYNTAAFDDSNRRFLIYTQAADGNYYAIDGSGNAVQIFLDAKGKVTCNLGNPNTLYWTISRQNNGSYRIRNVGNSRYLYPNGNNITSTSTSNSQFTLQNNGTVKLRGSTSRYLQLNSTSGTFSTSSGGSDFRLAYYKTGNCYIWADGTNGNLESLRGSRNELLDTVPAMSVITLPTEWTSPPKYSYTLRGWYDVVGNKYYAPGETVTVTDHMVLYADWVASTYNIGVFNSRTADTVSTSNFIMSYMFDYNYLFNTQSSNAAVTVSASSHSETWSMVNSGIVNYGGQQSNDLIFSDNDSEGKLCMPNNRDNNNRYQEATTITTGICSEDVQNLLFDPENTFDPVTGTGVLGKNYLGTGDHLFQIDTEPGEHYGYYYYDSQRNAASYHQDDGRFYVYDYLSATSDSISGNKSDFLPLNSPYANTNGKNVGTYTYEGIDGEYTGTTHYRYDSKYNSGDHNSTSNVATDYAYGMRMDIKFFLPKNPGEGGNFDLYGNDMEFEFSGDDDLWVLIDGKMVLDLGGIHQVVGGVIDFSTGRVTVEGTEKTSLMDLGITAGEHTMTVLYLERGASMSNCSIYFNLAPRYNFSIQKEDVLTRDVLNGAEFSVFMDEGCTIPAQLWPSKAAYDRDEAPTNTFIVTDGVADMWGMSSGNTYYIVETGAPDLDGYGLPEGIICLQFDKTGLANYEVIAPKNSNVSGGFTVHGFRINEETQSAYIIATNSPSWLKDTTHVQAVKVWEDNKSHQDETVTVYLTVQDADGTVRRLQEAVLGSENNWYHKWENLPKYEERVQGQKTVLQYGVEEAYVSGYYSKVEKLEGKIPISSRQWTAVNGFEDGKIYILKTSSGYLSTKDNAEDTGFAWVDEATAKSSSRALWTASVKGNTVRFTNQEKQTLSFWVNSDFYAKKDQSENNNQKQYFTWNSGKLYYDTTNTDYYLTSSMDNRQKFNYSTSSNSAMVITPYTETGSDASITVEAGTFGYKVTNTPLQKETSLTVQKYWNYGILNPSTLHEKSQVTIKLFANGKDTGRTVTLSLKNGWKETFRGLPYQDDDGNVISYTVEENWSNEEWIPQYGPIITTNGSPPTYSTSVTNNYLLGIGGPQLPSTGTAARMLYILCGGSIMLASLVYGILLRRKRERRMK